MPHSPPVPRSFPLISFTSDHRLFLRRKFKARISRDSIVTDAKMSCSLNSLSRKSSSVMSGVARTVFNIHLRFFSDRRFGFPPRCPTGAIVPVVRFRRNNFLIKLCLKSRGFCPRESHLRDGERLSRLLAIQTLAFCWSLASGKIVCQRKSLKLKKHKRREKSVFRAGFDYLRRLLSCHQNNGQKQELTTLILLLSCT